MQMIKNWIYEKIIPIQIWILRSQQKNWVSYYAKKLIKNSQNKDKKGFFNSFSEKWFEWMHPQKWATSLFLAFSFVFTPQFVLGIFNLQNFNVIDTNFLSTIWQVLASIMGISFVIAVFLTEYSQDRTYERRAFPIYISATSMIFTVMFGLLTLMSMGINLLILNSHFKDSIWVVGVSIWNTILFFLNLILTINLYIRTYQLLSPNYFKKILVTYHRKKVLERVYKELFKRVKRNLLVQFLQDQEIEFSIFRDDYKNKTKVIVNKTFSEIQSIDDINLELLKVAVKNAKRIDTEFNKGKIIFWGLPDNQVSNEYSEIASIDENLNFKVVTKLISNSIKTKPWQSVKLESATEDLLINRDLIAVAINAGQAESVESSLGLYIETIDAFLDSLKQLGYRFTPELVNSEDTWFNRWDIFDSVYHQYIDLLQEAIKSNNSEIIKEFVNFPRRIMIKAFEYKDHFAFKRFANLYPLIYALAKQHIQDNETSNQVTNRCGLLLAEFSNHNIKYKLTDKELSFDEVKELIAYAEVILVAFSQIAKSQIDNIDYSEYRLTISTIRRLLSEFIKKHDNYKVQHLELELNYSADKKSQTDLIQKLEKEKSLNVLCISFDNLTKSALFGLGAWICHKANTGTLSNEDFPKFVKITQEEFQSLDDLNEAYIKAITMEDRQVFNWNGWEMDEWQDEAYGESKFGSIHFSSWITIFFTYCALVLTPENASNITIKPRKEIKGMLDSIKSNTKDFLEKENWVFLRNRISQMEKRGKILENSYQAAYEKQVVMEELEIIKFPISKSKIDSFITEVEKAWKIHGRLREIFTYYGKYSPKPDEFPRKKLIPFGHYVRTPKELFLENPRVGYPLWGENYGRSLAQGEDINIAAYLNKVPTKSIPLEKFDEEIEKQILNLNKKGYKPIILFGHDLYEKIHNSKKFEPSWRITKKPPEGLTNFFSGYYEAIPVFSYPGDSNSILICDFSKFGSLVQYKVDKDIPDFPLQIRIEEITETRAKEFITKNPKLLIDSVTKSELSEEEALRKIQQEVILAIWEKFDVEDIDLNAGFIIRFKDTKKKISNKNSMLKKKSKKR